MRVDCLKILCLFLIRSTLKLPIKDILLFALRDDFLLFLILKIQILKFRQVPCMLA